MKRYQRCLEFVRMRVWHAITAIHYERYDDAKKHLYNIIDMIDLEEDELVKFHMEPDRFQVTMYISESV